MGRGVPQKALCGGIPGDGFGIWGRFWSHFEGKSRQKMTNLSGIDFCNTPTKGPAWVATSTGQLLSSSFFFITLGLEMSGTKVYEPYIRALVGTASHLCEAVVPESRTVPIGTALGPSSSGGPRTSPTGSRKR